MTELIHIHEAARLPLFWAVTVTVVFLVSYRLHLADHVVPKVGKGRMYTTMLIGTLAMLSTYGATLAELNFELKHLIMLAFVAAHGWTADDLMDGIVAKVAEIPRVQESPR